MPLEENIKHLEFNQIKNHLVSCSLFEKFLEDDIEEEIYRRSENVFNRIKKSEKCDDDLYIPLVLSTLKNI